MREAAVSILSTWQNFYVIVGSSAGALTGLMFIVITLLSGARARTSSEPIAAFSTPNVVHFGAALLIAIILSAPWQALWNASLLLGFCGVGGMIYIAIVVRRTRRQTDYTPVLEDWLWHTILPLVSYVTLLITAFLLPGNSILALFIVGAATVLLLFIGIHNAWDNVTYIATEIVQTGNKSQEER